MMIGAALLDMKSCWEAVASRDRTQDGAFVYAVATTGIYCRPSCASRQPKRENVTFFALPAAAEQAGYRACKRCRPQEAAPHDPHLRLAQAAAEHMNAHAGAPQHTALSALGAAFGYDPQHIQRVFKQVLGLTPKQYADALKLRHFKAALRDGAPVLEAGLNAGYGSASRTYENGARALGMTPVVYKRGGAGMALRYTIEATSLGIILVAATAKGICAVGIYSTHDEAHEGLRREYPRASQIDPDHALSAAVRQIVAHVEHGQPLDLPLDIQATAFQWRVWRALQAIPRGETRSYAQVAQAIGAPSAARAVASACASNRAAIIIPCHRVIKRDGSLSGYKWGVSRKQKLLAAERARAEG